MSKHLITLPLAAMLAVSLVAVPAVAKGKHKHKHLWVKYEAKEYGFSMNVPRGTKFKEKEWKDGWAGLYANYRGVQLWGLTHKGVKHTVPQFQIFGVLVTGIPGKKWKLVEEGKNDNGFKWYKVHQAEKGKHVVFALYGVGEKGSYMLVLKTTRKSFNKDKDKYLRWYNSINAF